MPRIRPVSWVASHAASGLRDVPRNGAWLLSKALGPPVSATESAVQDTSDDTSDGLRRMTIAVADKLPGGPDSVGIKLKRAETAVARAKEAERQALAEAQTASEQRRRGQVRKRGRETARA